MTSRRTFMVTIGASLFAAPLAALAQPKQKPALIGWLNLGSPAADGDQLAALKEGLAALGYKAGQHYSIAEYWGYSRREKMQSLAQELAAMKPRLIVAAFADVIRSAVKAAPATPIVMIGGDPVEAGFAKSLARPGGMITGLSNVTGELREKYVELMLAAVPGVRRLGILHSGRDPLPPGLERSVTAARRSAAQRSADVRIERAATDADIEPAVARLANHGAQALVIFPSALLVAESERIARAAFAHRMPLIGTGRLTRGDQGALLSYSPAPMLGMFRRAAYYVDRILKGAHPGDLPIEQPTKFELVINMRTARLLGLEIPRELMVRADRVIE